MSTLLLRLSAPLQAWGADSKFERRGTMREPTKSGVVGLLAAALGRGRDESLDDLAALRYGVRTDQPGQLLRDFHTARIKEDKPPYVTERYYLADAVFLAGVEGDISLLSLLDSALHAPMYPLYLGRRSCPPAGRVSLGIRETPLEEALCTEPWLASEWYCRQVRRRDPKTLLLPLALDSDSTDTMRRLDLPLSFSQKHRRYAYRYINEKTVDIGIVAKDSFPDGETTHDPMETVVQYLDERGE
jgi:CRISPR system Cascade subunit CasD